MTNESLARSYLLKAQKRLKALAVLRDEEAHSDVVREAQELVELALKGTLRAVGIEPPKFHDVGGLLLEHESKFSRGVRERLPRAAAISERLRRERERAFDVQEARGLERRRLADDGQIHQLIAGQNCLAASCMRAPSCVVATGGPTSSTTSSLLMPTATGREKANWLTRGELLTSGCRPRFCDTRRSRSARKAEVSSKVGTRYWPRPSSLGGPRPQSGN